MKLLYTFNLNMFTYSHVYLFNRASRSVKLNEVKYGVNQQNKSNEKKTQVGVVDGEVVMEDCLAYGRVQIRTDIPNI